MFIILGKSIVQYSTCKNPVEADETDEADEADKTDETASSTWIGIFIFLPDMIPKPPSKFEI